MEKVILLPTFAMCGNEKSKFVQEQEASGLLNQLGIRYRYWEIFCSKCIIMNNRINKSLLTGDRFMPIMHLRQLDLCIVLVGHSQKATQECKNSKKKDSRYIYINEH